MRPQRIQLHHLRLIRVLDVVGVAGGLLALVGEGLDRVTGFFGAKLPLTGRSRGAGATGAVGAAAGDAAVFADHLSHERMNPQRRRLDTGREPPGCTTS